MLTRRSFIMLSTAGVVLAACGPQVTAERAAPPNVPLVHLRVSGSGTALPAVQKLGEGYETLAPDVRLEFPGGTNSGGAIRGVLESSLDIAVTNRPLSEAEQSEPLVYAPLVRDAVVFAVHQSVPIQRLSSAEIRDLFGGTTTAWSSIGGPDVPVIILDRDADESMRKLVLVPLLEGRSVPSETITLTSASDMLAALSSTPNAVGYTSLGLLRLRAPKNVVAIVLDDVVPSAAGVVSGAYPWSLNFGLVTRSDAPPATRAFVEHAVRSARSVLGPFEYEALSG